MLAALRACLGYMLGSIWLLFGVHLGSIWGPFARIMPAYVQKVHLRVQMGVQERFQHKTPFDLLGNGLGPPLGPQVGPMLEALERLGALLGDLGAVLGRSGTAF